MILLYVYPLPRWYRFKLRQKSSRRITPNHHFGW
jgi:hypothetical protein